MLAERKLVDVEAKLKRLADDAPASQDAGDTLPVGERQSRMPFDQVSFGRRNQVEKLSRAGTPVLSNGLLDGTLSLANHLKLPSLRLDCASWRV